MKKLSHFLLLLMLLISTAAYAANFPSFSTTIPSETTVGASLSGKTVTLTNNLPFALSGLSSSVSTSSGLGWTTSSNTCTGTLAGGASCVLTGDIVPTAAGDLTLTYTINASNSRPLKETFPITVGAAPTLTASSLTSPTSIGTSQDLTFTYTNNATNMSITLSTESVTETGGVAWVETNDTCEGQTIAAGASCTVTGTYTPSASGTQSVTLTLGNDNIKTASATASASVNTTNLYLATGVYQTDEEAQQPLLFSSSDAETWTNSSSNLPSFTSASLRKIRWDGSSWLTVGTKVVGDNIVPLILGSTDGSSWTAQTAPTAITIGSSGGMYITGLGYANNQWLVSGYYSATDDTEDAKMILMKGTTDGTWTSIPFNENEGYSLDDLTYGNNFWLTVGANRSGESVSPIIEKSNAAITSWTSVAPSSDDPIYFTSVGYNADASGDVKAVAGGLVENSDPGPLKAILYTAGADADSWTERTISPALTGQDLTIKQINYANGKWVAVGYIQADDGGTYKIFFLTSTDGETWTSSQLSTEYANVDFGDLYWNGSKWILVGAVFPEGTETAQSLIMQSTDGSTWTEVTSKPEVSQSMLFGVDKGEG